MDDVLIDKAWLIELADALDGAARFTDDHLRVVGLWIELGEDRAREIAGRLRAIAWGSPEEVNDG